MNPKTAAQLEACLRWCACSCEHCKEAKRQFFRNDGFHPDYKNARDACERYAAYLKVIKDEETAK